MVRSRFRNCSRGRAVAAGEAIHPLVTGRSRTIGTPMPLGTMAPEPAYSPALHGRYCPIDIRAFPLGVVATWRPIAALLHIGTQHGGRVGPITLDFRASVGPAG